MAGTQIKLKEYGKKKILVRLGRWNYAMLFGGQGGTKDAAEKIAQKAKELAPVLKELEQIATHPGLEQGMLKNSIRYEKVGPMSYIIGSNLDYAYFVELGVDHPGVSAGTRVVFWSEKEGRYKVITTGIKPHRMKAQPFMRPAILWGEKQLLISATAYLARGIKRMVLKG